MALVRILVDGYSLLHQWMDLAPGRPRHAASAREELINRLTQYQDATGTPITVVFDGSRPDGDVEDAPPAGVVKVLYSHIGQTADQVIERLAHRYQSYGEVLVVTSDRAERETVASAGALTSSCRDFIDMIEASLGDLEREIATYNQKVRSQFLRHP